MASLLDALNRRPPLLAVLEGPFDPHYRVDSWWALDYDRLLLCLNGCLYTELTRVEVIDTYHPMYEVMLHKLVPLAFLSMPVHDNPK